MIKQYEVPLVYAAKHTNEAVRMQSRSGGFFTALSDYILDQGGAVYGCVLNDSFEAIHIRTVSGEDRDRMRGSKYIQSNLSDTFLLIEKDIQDGIKVLFTGTFCQVSALKRFLDARKITNVQMENLLCVDILCHGVPSVRVWKDYIHYLEEKNHGKCVNVDFRNKRDYGWRRHIETVKIKGVFAIRSFDNDLFKRMFYSHEILRPACYECPYKTTKHVSDITIGDYWGIDKAVPGFNDDKGISLVLINNEHGKKVFDNISDSLVSVTAKIEDSLQPAIQHPFEMPDHRQEFWDDYNRHGFEYTVNKFFGISKRQEQIEKIKRMIHKIRFKMKH